MKFKFWFRDSYVVNEAIPTEQELAAAKKANDFIIKNEIKYSFNTSSNAVIQRLIFFFLIRCAKCQWQDKIRIIPRDGRYPEIKKMPRFRIKSHHRDEHERAQILAFGNPPTKYGVHESLLTSLTQDGIADECSNRIVFGRDQVLQFFAAKELRLTYLFA